MGIAIVTDPTEIEFLTKEIKRISELRRELIDRLVRETQLPQNFVQTAGVPGTVPPGAPVVGAAPAGGGAAAFGSRAGAIAGLAITGVAIAAIAAEDNNDPVFFPINPNPQSPSNTVLVDQEPFDPVLIDASAEDFGDPVIIPIQELQALEGQ